MKNENRNALFETTPVPKAFLTLAVPVVLSKIVSMIYNMADTYFIARTGDSDLVAGVSLCAPVFLLMISLGDLFGLGGSSVMSRLFGQQKDEEGKRVSGFTFYGAIAAPPAPSPRPKIKTGSKMILTMLPAMLPIMAIFASPSVRSWLAGISVRMINGAPSAIQM